MARKRAEPGAKLECELRPLQIVVNLVLIDENDALVTPDALPFGNSADGSAAENAIAWLEALPLHLKVAAAHRAENAAANGAQ